MAFDRFDPWAPLTIKFVRRWRNGWVEDMDLSVVIASVVPVAGIFLAALFGIWRVKRGALSILPTALFFALVLGVALALVSGALLDYCVAQARCPNRGDGNIAYFLPSLFCIPLYWIVAATARPSKRGED
jgi:hypothetical protein